MTWNKPYKAQRTKRIERPEQDLQIAIFNQLRPLMASTGYKQFMAFAVPNGGRRTPAEAAQFKRAGVMAGVGDIVLLFPEPEFFTYEAPKPKTVFVELKALAALPRERLKLDGTPVKTRERREDVGQSEEQINFMNRARALGFEYHIVAAPAGEYRMAVDKIYAILRENGVRC